MVMHAIERNGVVVLEIYDVAALGRLDDRSALLNPLLKLILFGISLFLLVFRVVFLGLAEGGGTELAAGQIL